MRLAIMADGEVGLEIVRYLADSYFEDIALLVTTEENAITALAQERGIRTALWSPGFLLAEMVRRSEVELGVLAWWPQILKRPLLDIPPLGWINTHPSLLPYNRGKHYNFWAIVEGAPFGVTLHLVDEGIDSGDVIAQQPLPYDWTDTGGTLYAKAQVAMVELFRKCYPTIRSGAFDASPQPLGIGSQHISSELDQASIIRLDEASSAREILNLLRARTFEGRPACRFSEDGVEYEVRVEIRKRIT